jgi:hypothetical protein
MKKHAIVAALALATSVAFSSTASAETVRLGVGADNSTSAYTNVYGPALKKEAAKVGIRIEFVHGGSVVNLERLYNGEIDAALAQGDVAVDMAAADEEFAEAVAPLGAIGSESVLCAMKKTGRLTTWDAIVDDERPEKPFYVSAGSEGSGTRFTVNNVRRKVPNAESATRIYEPEKSTRAVKPTYDVGKELARLRSGRRDLVCEVMTPDPTRDKGFVHDVYIDDQLTFLTIDNDEVEKIRDKRGQNAYTIADATIGGNIAMVYFGKGDKVRTIHTPVSVYVNLDSIDGKTMEKLQAIVQNPDLLPPDSPAGLAALAYRSALNAVN